LEFGLARWGQDGPAEGHLEPGHQPDSGRR
jgi:hypothetical protein